MPFQSPYPPLAISKCNIIDYMFPSNRPLTDAPLWIEAANPSNNLSQLGMLSWAKRFAVGLERLGIEKGQTVMVFTPNHIFVPMVYLAAAGSLRVFTGCNPAYTLAEVVYQMKTIDAALILIHPSLLEIGLKATKEARIPINHIFQFSDYECDTYNGIRDWRTLIGTVDEAERYNFPTLSAQDAVNTIAAINFSSGTTGLPKGVCVSHYNIVANASQCLFSKYYGTEQSESDPGDERWLAFLPLYHAYSQLFSIAIAGRLRIPVYVMPKFGFEDFMKYVEKYRITTLQTVPPILVMLNKRPEATKYDFSSVRHMLCGAAPLSRELQNEVSKVYNVVVAQGWGMTETTSAGFLTPGMMRDSTGAIGYLLPNTEARLVDDDQREITVEGKPGELYIRGPQIMLRYWNNEKSTQETLSTDGWLKTGDIAMVQQDRYWIVDRKKELIKVNGLQVAPAELEAILLENEDIEDAAVTGVMLNGNEFPRAYVVVRQSAQVTSQNVQQYVEKHAARHKWLVGGVAFVDEIPRLPSGKIVRKTLREWGKRDSRALEGNSSAKL